MKNLINPPALLRPAPFWSWNDKLDEAELRRQIREMAEKGWGSFIIHSRVGLVTGYLSDEWMALVKASIDQAKKTGALVWLYDEDKWPSGFAGGEVPEKNEAFRSRALVLVRKGMATKDDAVLCSTHHASVDYDICKRVSPLGSVWFNGASYVDLMNPNAVQAFLESTHERYQQACGGHFGQTIRGIFTDEPCYLYHNQYEVPVAPWSEYLPEFFEKINGYSILDKLPLLFFELEGYRKIRFDFYRAVSELLKQSFTKPYHDWCESNHLLMIGHFMAEDNLAYQTRWTGDVMSQYEFMHWPGIDKLDRNVEQIVTVKQVTSVAEQLGKERVFSEVFGCVGGQVSFFHRKWIADWQAVLGINFVNHHLSLYSMRGERKRDYPANLFYQQPWWDDEKEFSDYLGRLCAATSEGERMVDILVLQPLTSVWCEFSPARHEDSGFALEKIYDEPFRQLSLKLMSKKLDFHYGNEALIIKHGTVDGQKLKIGKHSYFCVIVPPALNLAASTLSLLQEYAQNGGTLIFTRALPICVDGKETVVEMPGAIITASLQDGVSRVVGQFRNRIKVTDKYSGANAASIYVQSRNLGHSTRHLLVNIDEKREVHATIDMGAHTNKSMAVFDLFNGELYKLESGAKAIDLIFSPAGSLLILCGEEARQAEKKLPVFLGSGVSFEALSERLPNFLIEKFDSEILEENVLVLNHFTLELDGQPVYAGPVCGSWHTHFYPTANGTPFRATYRFHSETNLKKCFAVIELAENLDAITFNDKPVRPRKIRGELGAFNSRKSWKDIHFTKVPLPEIKKGENVLVIVGSKMNNITGPGFHVRLENWKSHTPTEAEEVYICGHFSAKHVTESTYVLATFKKPSSKNLTKSGLPFYCGRVVLRASFYLKQKKNAKIYLKLNDAEMASAHLKVNGKMCGTLRWPPYVLDVTKAAKAGENHLELNMATTLVNAFGPNRRPGIKEEHAVGPHSFIRMDRYQEKYELFDFGLESVAVYVE